MRVLVTGANGFIGSHLTEALIERGDRVTCLVRRTSNLRWIEKLPVRLVYGELLDPPSLASAVADADIVFHAAALTRAPDRRTYFQANTAGTYNLCRATAEAGPPGVRFVFVSSLAAGGPGPWGGTVTESDRPRPVSWYGRSKLEAEAAVKSLLTDWVIVRPPVVYGPRDDGLLTFHRMAVRGFILIPGGGKRIFSLIHSADLVRGLLLAAGSRKAAGRTYYLSDGGVYRWERLAPIFRSILKRPVRARCLPSAFHPALKAILRLSDSLGGRPGTLNHQKLIELEQPSWAVEISRARRELAFEPRVGLEEGFRACYDWYREQGWL